MAHVFHVFGLADLDSLAQVPPPVIQLGEHGVQLLLVQQVVVEPYIEVQFAEGLYRPGLGTPLALQLLADQDGHRG